MRKCRNQPGFENPFINLDEVDDEPCNPFDRESRSRQKSRQSGGIQARHPVDRHQRPL